MELAGVRRAQRRALADQVLAANSVQAIWSFQRSLAGCIREAERSQKAQRQSDAAWHLHLLRVIGDALAWAVLHEHVIRQLAKNPGRAPYLIDQGSGFENTLRIAEVVVQRGTPVLIADLTHCIRIGDVILCRDPEQPGIIECKSGKKRQAFEHQGRRGRQLERMFRTRDYLNTGVALSPRDDMTLVTCESAVRPVYNWWAVEQVAREALSLGSASCLISRDEVLMAFSGAANKHSIESEFNKYEFESEGAVVGVHMVPIEEASADVPPPLNWEITRDLRVPLLEGDVILVHLLQRRAFLGRHSARAEVVDIDVVTESSEDSAYRVRVRDTDLFCSGNFTKRVLYRFETVESAGLAMLEAAEDGFERLEQLAQNGRAVSRGGHPMNLSTSNQANQANGADSLTLAADLPL